MVWIKLIYLAEDYSRNISVKLSKYLQWDGNKGLLSLFPLMRWFFKYFFANSAFWLPWQPIKFSGLDKIHMVGRGIFKEHFCKIFVKISAVWCYIWNLVRIGFIASEEMSFKRCRLKRLMDGRTTDACLYYKLT